MRPLTKPINVAWLLTNRCNYKCGFCWRVLDHSDISLSAAKEVTLKLARAGTLKISWAGGEPLLWPGIDELIRFTKNLGIETMLITNGSLLESVWPNGLPEYLDWLTLPLEGIGDEINTRCGRDRGHYTAVRQTFERYRDQRSLKLKINSVATALNRHHLIQVLPYLKKWRISRWKIFQFYPVRGFARKNHRKYHLADDDFESLRNEILRAKTFSATDCDVVIESRKDLDRSYFTLAPDAAVYVSSNGEDIYLGDLRTTAADKIFARAELDKRRYTERSEWMLRKRQIPGVSDPLVRPGAHTAPTRSTLLQLNRD